MFVLTFTTTEAHVSHTSIYATEHMNSACSAFYNQWTYCAKQVVWNYLHIVKRTRGRYKFVFPSKQRIMRTKFIPHLDYWNFVYFFCPITGTTMEPLLGAKSFGLMTLPIEKVRLIKKNISFLFTQSNVQNQKFIFCCRNLGIYYWFHNILSLIFRMIRW